MNLKGDPNRIIIIYVKKSSDAFRDLNLLPAVGVGVRWNVVEIKCFAGEWIGHYPGHFDEVIRIEQNGDDLEAVKVTGDDYVPEGEVTWRANVRTLRGEGQIAERDFQHPRFIPGKLIIVNPERIIFRWDDCGEVEYRRDE